jgi:formate hydrogenlyase subunit 3/multisubunit Na+/H+ antiporter MnhD subunit
VIGAVLVAALGALALGGVLVATRATFLTGLMLQAAGAVGIAVAGFWVLASGDEIGTAFTSAFVPRVGVDGLSGLFLGTLGLVAAPALVFSVRYLEPTLRGRIVGVLTAAFLLALAAVLCAREAHLSDRPAADQ